MREHGPVQEIELLDVGVTTPAPLDRAAPVDTARTGAGVIVVAVLGLALVWFAATDRADDRAFDAIEDSAEPAVPTDMVRSTEPAPEPPSSIAYRAVENFVREPGSAHLRELFTSLGGLDGLTIAEAEGSFDVVSFSAVDSDRLLAAHRRSYGPAANESVNELWLLADGDVDQLVWEPTIQHDFSHFNRDGTITAWVHGGGDGFAPREARVLTHRSLPIVSSSAPMYASRFVTDRGVTFALTSDGDYYSNEHDYIELIADDGVDREILDDGSQYAWIDVPTSGLLVAFPASEDGRTSVWDVDTRQRLRHHALAGRAYQAVGVSGSGGLAVGATSDGELEILDLPSGRVTGRFGGEIDVRGVTHAVTVDRDGSVAVTVERDGTVTIWWIGDDDPVMTFETVAAQPRWVSAAHAAVSTSVVSPDGRRMALREPARPSTPTSWRLVDIDVSSWLDRACALAQSNAPDAADTPLCRAG